MVASILFLAMFFTRKRGFRIFERFSARDGYIGIGCDDLNSLEIDSDPDEDFTSNRRSKVRKLCYCRITAPNTVRFRNNIHSRILQRFPFLIEMFYWIINYAFYRMTSVLSSRIFAGQGIWEVAQEHGIAVLEAEQYGIFSFLFPIREIAVQQWFMSDHQNALTVLNKCYALIHIPGTVGSVQNIRQCSSC